MLDQDNLPREILEGVDTFIRYLQKSVELRVSSIPPRHVLILHWRWVDSR